jgi:hypothetical protein
MKYLVRIGLICIICLTLNVFSVRAQETGWTTPIQLSFDKVSAWFPDLTTDEYGSVHVVWSQSTGNFDNVMYTVSKNGETWLPANDIIAIEANRGSEATRPRIIANNLNSELFLTYRYNQVFVASANNADAFRANAWETTAILSNMDQVAYFSDIKLDADGNLHLLTTWNVPTSTCEICYHVFYRRLNTDATQWTDAKDISLIDSGVAKPNLLVDHLGNLHAIWESSDSGGGAYGNVQQPAYLMYSHSIDGGNTWSDTLKLDVVRDESRNPAISEDVNGQLVVTWLGLPEDKIYFLLSDDGGESWSASEEIPGISGGWSIYNSLLDDASMAIDSDGMVHLVVIGRVDAVSESLQILHLTWDGDAWSVPDVIATYASGAPEWPRIAVSEGNILNAVWFLRDADHIWDTENGTYTIWYSRLETSAKAIPPKIRPTSTPTPVGTEQPTVISTVGTMVASIETTTPMPVFTETVMPTIPENYIPGENAAYKETDYLKLVAIAAVPALLFVGIIVAIVLFRRSRHH